MKTMSDSPSLTNIAKKYVWWKSPEETLALSSYFLCHVMNLGTWEDAMVVFDHYGRDTDATPL